MNLKKKLTALARSVEAKAAVVASSAAGVMTVAANAEETTSAAITTAFQSGFQTMASDALGMIAVIIPIALGVAGAVFLSRKAIGWFKSLAK